MTGKVDRPSDDGLTKKWTILAILLAVPVFLLFAYFGEPERGRAAAIGAMVIVMVARLRWELRRKEWYWITLAAVVAYHILLILFTPWTAKGYPGYTLLPIAVLDAAAVYGVIKLVEKAVKSRTP